MSLTLDKLRALKRQAGDASLSRGPRAPAPAGAASAAVPDRASVDVGDFGGLPDGARTGPVSQPTGPLDTAGPGAPDPARRAALQPGHDPGGSPSVSTPRAIDAGDAGNTTPDASPLPDAGHGPASPAGAAGAGRVPRDARAASLDSLRRLLGVRERVPAPAPPRAPVDRSLPGEEIAPGLHYVEASLPADVPAAALPLAFARRTDAVDPRALLFFDTETTGLAGGTGTRAFMIGAADWLDGRLRVRQLFMSTMAAEAAMLRTFAGWLRPDTVLASYNGRSYDAPLLKTRYRLARLPDPLHALDHVDLLHPTRRRYRGRWDNCKLATIERELLRIVREDDLPGSQAPMAWLGFLRGGGSNLLRRVAAHNHQDVVTLAQLLLRLVEAQALEGETVPARRPRSGWRGAA